MRGVRRGSGVAAFLGNQRHPARLALHARDPCAMPVKRAIA